MIPKQKLKNCKTAKISITQKMSNDYEIIAASYHEASHTIVALTNLILVDSVSLTPNRGGDTNYFTYEIDRAEDEALKKLVLMAELKTIYAGLVGEKMYYKNICGSSKFPMYLRHGSYFDTSIGSGLIKKYNLSRAGKERFNFKNEIREEVKDILDKHWEAVKIVAHSLYKKKKLTFSDLKYLLTRIKDEDKEFWKDKFKRIKLIYDEKNNISEKLVKNLITAKPIK